MTAGTDEDGGDVSERADVGGEMGSDVSNLSSILGDAYRGELDRETTWRSRLDQTTTWAVTVMAAILTWAFSSGDNPHYIILVAVLVLAAFLLVEARRYRDYDVYRARVRLFQKNLLADALDPEAALEDSRWRVQLGEDYRTPTTKISMLEAVANRLRRIYLALLGVLLIAWVFRITAFAPREEWLSSAAVAAVPGFVVVATVGGFYAVVLAITLWPRDREAMGEFREGKPGEWKDGN